MARSYFAGALARRQNNPEKRRWLFVPYDQLSERIGPLSREDPAETGIIVVENRWKASRRPYHRQKLALVLANQRHFALEQAARGVAVRHIVTDQPYRDALGPVLENLGRKSRVRAMVPAERELRADIRPLVEQGLLELIPHEGWLTTREQFLRSQRTRPWRMDAFYRQVRRETGMLMERGKPVGGKFSFDAENRQPWPGQPTAPSTPRFPADEIKQEVGELIEARFARHPGRLDLEALPATAEDADSLWGWAEANCMPLFGPFEDAMSTRSSNLFHTRLSALLNLSRLSPRRILHQALELKIPLASKEGFVRQILGWREFVRHVHDLTDGFRGRMGFPVPVAERPGSSGYEQWSGEPWRRENRDGIRIDGGAAPSFIGADSPLPVAYWGRPSGLACLDRVVDSVWAEGYSHHITRLMILSNLATLIDTAPRELADWFWIAYVDAYDWVVEPNVLGMGTFAAGDLMTTKPYVSGAAYINRMSDYCEGCEFDPGKNCPITPLYWAFLERHRERFAENPRMRLPLAGLAKRSAEKRQRDAATFRKVADELRQGRRLRASEF